MDTTSDTARLHRGSPKAAPDDDDDDDDAAVAAADAAAAEASDICFSFAEPGSMGLGDEDDVGGESGQLLGLARLDMHQEGRED